MIWHLYPLTFRVRTPVHIGFHKLGFIQRTRAYLMGRNFWGAVTSHVTRRLGDGPAGSDYERVSALVKEYLRFGYAYLLDNATGHVLIPHYTEDGLVYGEKALSAAAFEARFIRSYGSTAIDPFASAAEGGSLHEIECLIAYQGTEAKQPSVRLQGCLFAKEGGDSEVSIAPASNEVCIARGERRIDIWKDILLWLRIGGEQGYGYGLVIGEGPFCEETSGRLLGCYAVDLSKAEAPVVTIGPQKPIPAHLNVHVKGFQGAGEVEPLIGREWENLRDGTEGRGAGRALRRFGAGPSVYWVPGSVHTGENSVQVRVGAFGLLEPLS